MNKCIAKDILEAWPNLSYCSGIYLGRPRKTTKIRTRKFKPGASGLRFERETLEVRSEIFTQPTKTIGLKHQNAFLELCGLLLVGTQFHINNLSMNPRLNNNEATDRFSRNDSWKGLETEAECYQTLLWITRCVIKPTSVSMNSCSLNYTTASVTSEDFVWIMLTTSTLHVELTLLKIVRHWR
jgi:hypothetical protein